eukprot:1733901-Pleurochrysis_carterae.AAC.2
MPTNQPLRMRADYDCCMRCAAHLKPYTSCFCALVQACRADVHAIPESRMDTRMDRFRPLPRCAFFPHGERRISRTAARARARPVLQCWLGGRKEHGTRARATRGHARSFSINSITCVHAAVTRARPHDYSGLHFSCTAHWIACIECFTRRPFLYACENALVDQEILSFPHITSPGRAHFAFHRHLLLHVNARPFIFIVPAAWSGKHGVEHERHPSKLFVDSALASGKVLHLNACTAFDFRLPYARISNIHSIICRHGVQKTLRTCDVIHQSTTYS